MLHLAPGFSPTLEVCPPDGRLRLITLGFGLIVFIWLTLEDNAVWPVAILGIILATLSIVWLIRQQLAGSTFTARQALLGATLLGGIGGLGSAISTAGLMFFKNALHAHAFWDYPPAMVAAMLTRSPSWALAGGLVGIGVALLWMRHKTIGISEQKDH